MDNDVIDNDDDLDANPLYISPMIRIKANLKLARQLVEQDVSAFKINSAYRLKEDNCKVLLINDIGPDPISRLPTGYGLLVTTEGVQPASYPLSVLVPGPVR